MALIHLQDAPTVAPSSSPGNDYDNVQAPAAAFGAATAKAGEQFGQQTEQAGQNVDQIALLQADRHNQIVTDDAFNKFQNAAENITYGNPSDPSAPPGLYTLHGADALSAGPVAAKALSDQRDAIAASLPTDAARLQFDQQSRRLLQYKSSEISSHLQAQSDNYGIAVNEAKVANSATAAGNAWNSDDAFMHAREDARQGAVQQYQIKYGHDLSPELTQEAIRGADSRVVSAAVLSASQTDPVRAQHILQSNIGNIDPHIAEQLTQHLQTVGTAAQADDIVSRHMGLPGSTGPTGDIADAIHGQESGGRSTSATSVDNAQGGWQVIPSTFAQYAKPGESISVPADNERVGRRIIADLSQRFNNDPARVAVGYFSGPGNVAPPGSPTPWLQNKADGNGTTVAAYVSGVLGRMQRSPGSSAPAAAPAQGAASVTSAANSPAPGTPAFTTHADERFPPPGTNVTLAAAHPDATNEFPGVEKAAYVPAPSGGGYAPDVPPATPDSPHDTPVAQRAPVATAAPPTPTLLGSTPQNTAAPLPDYDTVVSGVLAETAGNPRLQAQALAKVQQRFAIQKRETQENYEKAANPLVTQMGIDPTKIDQVKDIAMNPAFNSAQKLDMMNALSKRLADYNSDGGDKDAKTYGQGFWGYYRAVTADSSDPGRITDPSVLVKAAGQPGGLTMAGVEKLQSVLAGRRTPEGDAEVQMQKTLMQAARQQLVAPDAFGQRDPKGEERLLAFQASAFSAIDAAKKGGATAADIYSPDSPKYVGKSISSFKRTPAQITKDLMDANADPTEAGAAPAPEQPGFFSRVGSMFSSAPKPPDLSSPDTIRQAFQSGTITRQQAIAANAAMRNRAAAGGALPMAKSE